MVKLQDFASYADSILDIKNIADYDNAVNGIQCLNKSGNVTKIACAVDAGLSEIKEAIKMKADILMVHHGLFWNKLLPFKGVNYEIIKALIEGDLAVYSSHLPLDANLDFGNNASIAKALKLEIQEPCFDFYGTKIGVLCNLTKDVDLSQLNKRLKKLFPNTFKAIEFGSKKPKRVAICSGGAGDCIDELANMEVDTFITGEIKEHHYVKARDYQYNVYACGHYCTETFGIKNLAKLCAEKFKLEYEFIKSNNMI